MDAEDRLVGGGSRVGKGEVMYSVLLSMVVLLVGGRLWS